MPPRAAARAASAKIAEKETTPTVNGTSTSSASAHRCRANAHHLESTRTQRGASKPVNGVKEKAGSAPRKPTARALPSLHQLTRAEQLPKAARRKKLPRKLRQKLPQRLPRRLPPKLHPRRRPSARRLPRSRKTKMNPPTSLRPSARRPTNPPPTSTAMRPRRRSQRPPKRPLRRSATSPRARVVPKARRSKSTRSATPTR